MRLFEKFGRAIGWNEAPARIRPGMRVYAVGDVHGRRDLLTAMLAQVAGDLAAQPIGRAILIFLGDVVDRGPESAGVIEQLRTLSLPPAEPVFLLGNHEEALLRVLAGEPGLLDNWLRFGGDTLAQSYGLDAVLLADLSEEEATARLRAAIPDPHVAFLHSFRDTVSVDDYLFVHAGIRPGIALDEQATHDLRWIREPFLSDTKRHEQVVVHGHTIVTAPEDRGNRIAIDTGAYRSGVLSALVLEGTSRRFLRAETGRSACPAVL